MAILKKRVSKSSLPQVYEDRGALTSERPSDRLTSEISNRPDGLLPAGNASVGARPALTSRTTARPSTTLTNAAKKPAGTLGSATTRPVIGGSATKPATGSSLTTKLTGAARPTISKTTGKGAGNTSSLAKTLTSALAGAGVGLAGKKIYDTFVGGKKTDPKNPKDPVKPPVKPPVGPPKPTVVPPKPPVGPIKPPVKPPVGPPKPPVGPVKPPVKPPVGPPKPPVGPVKPPVKPPVGPSTPPVRPPVSTGESSTVTAEDGSTITYDAMGNPVSETGPTNGNEDGYYQDEDGNFYDAMGNPVGTGNEYYQDDDGNFYDAMGNPVGTTDPNDEVADSGYYQDDDGNIYDADGNLAYEASYDDTEDGYSEDEIADYEYTDDYGNVYDFYGNMISEGSGEDSYSEDEIADYRYTDDDGNEYDYYGNIVSEAPSEDDYAYEDYLYDGNDYDEDYYGYDDSDYYGKKGGLITMMKRGGGVRHFEDGGYSDSEYFDDEENPYMIAQSTGDGVYDSPSVDDVEYFDDGSYIEYMNDGSSITYDSDGNVYEEGSNPALNNGSGEYTQTFDDGSSITYDEMGNPVSTTDAPDEDGNYTQVFDDGSSITYDGMGNPVSVTEATDGGITSAGSGSVRNIYKDTTQTPEQIAKDKLQQLKDKGTQTTLLDTVKEALSGSGYMGAGAAGAVLGALLGNTDLFSGGNSRNEGIDMSKVGNIPARTTDFGIGPANYTPYQDYAARDEMPDLYGNELYRNLNAPGFNPVNEGDYGYEEAPVAQEAAKPMAKGGLPSPTQTHYTFGRPVDPLEKLKMTGRTPMQPVDEEVQEEEMVEENPMVQEMRKGGLPALSNVPMAQGRLDFRQGSAVHGPGDGQSDDIPAMLADGEYVIDADTVAQIGNGSTKAGAQALDKFRESIRAHKRSAPVNKIPPKTKTLTSYLKGK